VPTGKLRDQVGGRERQPPPEGVGKRPPAGMVSTQ